MPAARAEFLDLQAVLVLLLILGRRVIAVLTVAALERYDFAHTVALDRGFQFHHRRPPDWHIYSEDAIPPNQQGVLAVLFSNTNPESAFVSLKSIK